MKKNILIFISLMACCLQTLAQQKNIVKLSISDCVNCVSAFSYILKQDPAVTILIRAEYAPDSLDVMEKFDLSALRRQIIWNDKLYDSLSREPESELIQFCGNKEYNRSGLRKLNFLKAENCD